MEKGKGLKNETENTERWQRNRVPKYSRRARKSGPDSSLNRKAPKKERITGTDKWLMTGTAIFFDIFAGIFGLLDYAIPLVGTILSTIITSLGFMTMWLWFAMRRVSLFNSQKKAWTFVFAAAIEAIPYVNIIPAVTAFTLRTIAVTKLEDVERRHPTLSKLGK